MWLGVTTLLGALSGWYRLMQRFPDRPEPPLLALRNQSGSLGLVAMNSVLCLSACPSGLRIGIMRIFGPFCRDLFVPWGEIQVSRKSRWFGRTAVLEFGHGLGASLSIPAHVADRLAVATAGTWPEPGPFVEETKSGVGSRVMKQWLLRTTLAAVFLSSRRVLPLRQARHRRSPSPCCSRRSCSVSARSSNTFAKATLELLCSRMTALGPALAPGTSCISPTQTARHLAGQAKGHRNRCPLWAEQDHPGPGLQKVYCALSL